MEKQWNLQHSRTNKQKQRSELDAAIKTYLDNGGTITKLEVEPASEVGFFGQNKRHSYENCWNGSSPRSFVPRLFE
jgi:hypothetical protein